MKYWSKFIPNLCKFNRVVCVLSFKAGIDSFEQQLLSYGRELSHDFLRAFSFPWPCHSPPPPRKRRVRSRLLSLVILFNKKWSYLNNKSFQCKNISMHCGFHSTSTLFVSLPPLYLPITPTSTMTPPVPPPMLQDFERLFYPRIPCKNCFSCYTRFKMNIFGCEVL